MCFSSSVSFGAAAVLIGTGAYASLRARSLHTAYRMWALTPVLFGLQQAFEGLVWQGLHAGNSAAVRLFALGFHFFSHFLWLWWFPLCSYLLEPGKIRKRIFGVCTVSGVFSGTLVYSVMLLHSEWMSVAVREHSIVYDFTVPYQSTIHIPITPAALYGLIILIPLLCSSHKLIRIFGGLAVMSMALASAVYDYAYVSVWCFFVAALSLYLLYMIRHAASAESDKGSETSLAVEDVNQEESRRNTRA